MPEFIVVFSDAEDRALHAGRVVTLPTHGAPFVHVTLAGKRIKLGDAETNGGSAPPTSTASLMTQRGDCPYCDKKDKLLSPHIRSKHPGKVVPWLGPNPVKCARCAATFPTTKSRDTHVRMKHKTSKKPSKKSGGTSE